MGSEAKDAARLEGSYRCDQRRSVEIIIMPAAKYVNIVTSVGSSTGNPTATPSATNLPAQ
jgi:hypothetical protein